MRINEFTERSDKPSAQQLTALAEYLLGRADDEDTQHTVPIGVFISMSRKISAELRPELCRYLLGRADDEDTQHTVPIGVFLSMAHNMGINITDQQLRTLATQDPLKNIIQNVDADNIVLVGAGITGEEGADTMTVDQAQDTVAGMADAANPLT